jgi:hypothetical protein
MFTVRGCGPRPTPKLEDHPLSAVRDCLFSIFAATLCTWRMSLHLQPEDVPWILIPLCIFLMKLLKDTSRVAFGFSDFSICFCETSSPGQAQALQLGFDSHQGRGFSLLRHIKNTFGAHQDSCPLGIRSS